MVGIATFEVTWNAIVAVYISREPFAKWILKWWVKISFSRIKHITNNTSNIFKHGVYICFIILNSNICQSVQVIIMSKSSVIQRIESWWSLSLYIITTSVAEFFHVMPLAFSISLTTTCGVVQHRTQDQWRPICHSNLKNFTVGTDLMRHCQCRCYAMTSTSVMLWYTPYVTSLGFEWIIVSLT